MNHLPQDELRPQWDFSGFVVLARFTLDVARDGANADQLPTWNSGDEFQPAQAKLRVKYTDLSPLPLGLIVTHWFFWPLVHCQVARFGHIDECR